MVGIWNVTEYCNCHCFLHTGVKWCSEPQTWIKGVVNALVKVRFVNLLLLKMKCRTPGFFENSIFQEIIQET